MNTDLRIRYIHMHMVILQKSAFNRNLEISTAPTIAKSREPAYSKAPSQYKIDRRGVKIGSMSRFKEVRQTVR